MSTHIYIRYLIVFSLTWMLYACGAGDTSDNTQPTPSTQGPLSIANIGTIPVISSSNTYVVPIYNNSDTDTVGVTYNIVSNQSGGEVQTQLYHEISLDDQCSTIEAHKMCEFVISESLVTQYMSGEQGSVNLVATDANGGQTNQVINYQNLSNQPTNNGLEFSSSLSILASSADSYATAYLFNTSTVSYSIESLILNNPHVTITNLDSLPSIVNPGQVISLVIKANGVITENIPQLVAQSASTLEPGTVFVTKTNIASIPIAIPILNLGMLPLLDTTKSDSVVGYLINTGDTVANITSIIPSSGLSITSYSCSNTNQILPQGSCSIVIKTTGASGNGVITVNYDNSASISQSVSWYSQGQPVLMANINPSILVTIENVSNNAIINVSNTGVTALDNPIITQGGGLINSVTPMSTICGLQIAPSTSCSYQVGLNGISRGNGQIPLVLSGTYGIDEIPITTSLSLVYQSMARPTFADLAISANQTMLSIMGDAMAESTVVFTITNNGGVSASILAVPELSPATNFSLLANTCVSSLPSGASCSQTYRYGPTPSVQTTAFSGYATLNIAYSDGANTNLAAYQLAVQIIPSDMILNITTTPDIALVPIAKSGDGSTFTISFNTNYTGSTALIVEPVNSNFVFNPPVCSISLDNPNCSINVSVVSESVIAGGSYPITFKSNAYLNPESLTVSITYPFTQVGESMPLPAGACNPCGLVNGLAIANGNILASFSNGAGIYTIPVDTNSPTSVWTYYAQPYAHQVLTYEVNTNILYGVGGNDAQVFSYNPLNTTTLNSTYTAQIGSTLNNAGAVQYGLAVWDTTLYVAGTDAGATIINPPVCYGENTLSAIQAYTCVYNNNESSYTNSLLYANGYLYQGRGDYSVWYVELNSDHSIPTESAQWRKLGVTSEQMGYNNSRVFGLAYDALHDRVYMAGSPKKGWAYGTPSICSIQASASASDEWSCVKLNTDPILRLAIDPNDITTIYGSTYNNTVIRFQL